MGRRVVYLFSIVLIFLLLASCGVGAIPTTTTSQPKTTAAPPPAATTGAPGATTSASTKPKYGGILIKATGPGADPNGAFDPGLHMSVLTPTIYLTHDKLLQGDWAKGPAGTQETGWLNYLGNNFNLLAPSLAEGYDLPDSQTIIWHIRKDVHFWNKPPVNGRELTAEDVAWSINREWVSTYPTFNRVTWPPGSEPTSVKAIDKYTVEMKVPAAVQGLHILATGAMVYILPPELIQQNGNADDWRKIVGTGPWMLTDYVSGSSITFARNPNYWEKNPVGPGKGDQLPYEDGIKWLIIGDASTQQAAFRTGKIDYYKGLSFDDYDLLSKQLPSNMQHQQMYGVMRTLNGRMDKADLPFKDLRVRQALNLAVNKQEILDKFYKGHGELLSWPWYSWAEHQKAYISLKDLPAAAQELFTYNPDKAKQLLKDAGYPNGFKTQIVTTTDQVDLLSIAKADLAKVGIDMDIKVLEYGVYNSVNRARTQDQMIFKESKMFFIPWMMHEVRKESFDNLSFYEAPETRAAYEELQPYIGKDGNKAWQILKDITPFMIEQAPMGGFMPVPYVYDMWWPWVKNFYDATSMSYWAPETNLKYSWVDQEMKRGMGH